MPVDYKRPSPEVKKLVKVIRRKHYPKFKAAKILTLMRVGGKWSKLGTISRVSVKQRRAGVDADYVLTLNGPRWDELDKKQRRALVDHELQHMCIQKSKKGKSFKLRHHNVEEFNAIIERYGLWQPSLESMYQTMRKSKK